MYLLSFLQTGSPDLIYLLYHFTTVPTYQLFTGCPGFYLDLHVIKDNLPTLLSIHCTNHANTMRTTLRATDTLGISTVTDVGH